MRSPFAGRKEVPPASGTLEDCTLIPEATANPLSLLTFQWITPLLSLGYARPLEATDLFKLQADRQASVIAARILESFEKRIADADAYNARLASGAVKPSLLQSAWWTLRRDFAARENRWRVCTGRKRPSLVMAMNDSVAWWFWSSGLLKVIADTAQITSPLVVQASPFLLVHMILLTLDPGHHQICHRFLPVS